MDYAAAMFSILPIPNRIRHRTRTLVFQWRLLPNQAQARPTPQEHHSVVHVQ